MTSAIQVRFGEPELPQPVPVRQVAATARSLPGPAWVDARHIPGRTLTIGRADRRAVEVERLVDLIRRALQKRGGR